MTTKILLAIFFLRSFHHNAQGMTRQSTITQKGFDRLLSHLNQDRELAGQEYERVRGRLILYFQCRDIVHAEDCADEAINRVIIKLETDHQIRDLVTYIFGVARMVLLETHRAQLKQQEIEDEHMVSPIPSDEVDELQRYLDCLKHCLQSLPAEDRDLITQYYQEQKRARINLRQELARRFDIDLNALRVRAYRLRNSLQKCVRKCAREGKTSM
jgi:DNA-directed RNA polymerase specialized sigma24 family protein